jgi:hypothetical protein
MLRVCADLDASADLAELRRLFVNLDLVAGLHQAGGGRETAEACARNDDLSLLHDVRYSPGAIRVICVRF